METDLRVTSGISRLGIPKDSVYWRGTHTSLFTVALFSMVQKWIIFHLNFIN